MRRLHPATIITAFLPHLGQALRNLIPAIFAASFTGGDSSELMLGLIGVVSGFGSVAAYITTRFGIEEGKFVLRQGWIYRKERTILLDRVQNVNLRQGWLERLFGAWRVDIETAAGATPEITLNVVSREDAERLRAELAPQGAVEGRAEAAPIYQAGRNEILWAAATENHALQLLLLIGLNVPVVGFIVRKGRDWIPLLAGVPVGYWVFVGLCVASVLLAAGWLWGIGRLYFAYHGFTLRSDEGVFRIRRGLVTRIENVVPAHRVRSLELKEPWLQRRLGLCSLHAFSAGGYGESFTPSAMLAPILDRTDAQGMARRVWPRLGLDDVEWRPAHRIALTALLVRLTIFTMVFAGVARGFSPFHASAVVALGAIGIVFAFPWYRSLGYAMDEAHLFLRQGRLQQTTTIIPWEMIEFVAYSEPPMWRKAGVGGLTVTMLGRMVTFPAVSRAEFERIAVAATRLRQGEARAMDRRPFRPVSRVVPVEHAVPAGGESSG